VLVAVSAQRLIAHALVGDQLAVLQRLNVISVERKTLQVGKPWRIAEHPECQIAGQLAKPDMYRDFARSSSDRRIQFDVSE
jgi:hypothetical protein